jgi:hypothetical protein
MIKRVAVLALIPAVPLLLAQFFCLPQGIALSASTHTLNSLKNRTARPHGADFDGQVTLSKLLQPGEDRERWSTSRGAAIEGYVVTVQAGGVESTNCFSFIRRDTHIEVALRPDSPPRERIILEVTPPLREWAKAQGMDWSHAALARELTGRWCRFEGWLLFDLNHAKESENTRPGGAANWRATAWEIHPVTSIKVLTQ